MDRDDRLISKKELLAKYGISYGSLYRWKRKGLIPELILTTKEDTLLDELAAKLSGEAGNDGVIMIETAYGRHSYKLSDVQKISVSGGNVKKDVTDVIINLLKEDKK